MPNDNDWLKDAIIGYIQNTDKQLNSIDIVSYFKLRVDITLFAIKDLEAEGRISRHDGMAGGWNGNHHYEVV
ncbi:MAG: hypothetical protein V3R81_15390 [Gammaproteobacteria bacterium]